MAETLNISNQVVNSDWKDDIDVDYAIYGGDESRETAEFINPSRTEENPETIEKIKKLQVKLAINGLSKFRKQQIIKAA